MEGDDYWSSTIEELSDLLPSGPVLKPHLLQRPPFKLLMDIIKAINKSTAIFSHLFSQGDFDKDFHHQKAEKIRFLEAAMGQIANLANLKIRARASKIVCGLEPELTNEFLREMAKCARNAGKNGNNLAAAVAADRTIAAAAGAAVGAGLAGHEGQGEPGSDARTAAWLPVEIGGRSAAPGALVSPRVLRAGSLGGPGGPGVSPEVQRAEDDRGGMKAKARPASPSSSSTSSSSSSSSSFYHPRSTTKAHHHHHHHHQGEDQPRAAAPRPSTAPGPASAAGVPSAARGLASTSGAHRSAREQTKPLASGRYAPAAQPLPADLRWVPAGLNDRPGLKRREDMRVRRRARSAAAEGGAEAQAHPSSSAHPASSSAHPTATFGLEVVVCKSSLRPDECCRRLQAHATIDINFLCNSEGWRPLHIAARYGHPGCVRDLVTRGAYVNVTDNIHRTPLHVAVYHGHEHAVRALLDCGAMIDAQTVYGDTPLHIASQKGYTAIIDLLVHHGAEVYLPDSLNRLPHEVGSIRSSVTMFASVKSLVGRNKNRDEWRRQVINTEDKDRIARSIRSRIKGSGRASVLMGREHGGRERSGWIPGSEARDIFTRPFDIKI